MQKKLLVLSFIEGAAVMAAELCGAKLLSPVFGSSLYVWASVMGATLLALALGYFYGGKISAAAGEKQKKLFLILVLASMFLLLMPVISHYAVPRISYLPFTVGVIISTFCLLFFPVFLLGASSPLFIILQTNELNPAGKASGYVYAVSTAGGILSTFLCGFWFIPLLGLTITLLTFAVLLFLATMLVFKSARPVQVIVFACYIYFNLQFITKPDTNLETSDSLLGHLEVSDIVSKDGPVRLLRVNSIIQTEMYTQSQKSASAYVHLLDSLVPATGGDRNALVLGLGGGLTANLLVKRNYKVTAVEFDERIIEAAKKYFYLDKNVTTVCNDARYYLNTCRQKFSLVLVDVFKAEEQPSHVITVESLQQLKANLEPDAIIFINWHGYTNEDMGKGTAVLYNTLAVTGFHVLLTSHSQKENERNIIFVASCDQNQLRAVPKKYVIEEKLPAVSIVNTDDQPVLEKYNGAANKAWRTIYLRYYQAN